MKTQSERQEPLLSQQQLSWLLFIVLAVIWGSSFMLIQIGLKVYSPLQVASLRLSSAFVAISFLGIRFFRYIPPAKLRLLLLSGFLGSFFPAFLFAFAQTHINSSIAGILNSLTPFFTFLIGAAFFRQQVSWLKVVGLLIGLLGAVSIFLVKGSEGLSIDAYALLVVVATICYACNVHIVKTYLSDIKPLHLSAVSLTMVGSIAFVYLLSTDFVQVTQQRPDSFYPLLSVVFLGVSSTAFALVLFNRLLQLSSALFTSSVTYFIPIVAVFWGLVFNESFFWWHLLGMLAIIVGVFIVNRSK